MLRKLWALSVSALLAVAVGACSESETPAGPDPDPDPTPEPQPVVVEATGISEPGEHRMELSVDEVLSGWVTLRFTNETEETEHFALISRLPDGITVEDYPDGVSAFQEFLDAINRGEDGSDVVFPEWLSQLVPVGGPGITAPGRTSETIVFLEPGEYVIECYMKTDAAQFHSFLGMFAGLTVTAEESGAPEPEADFAIRISSAGFQLDGNAGSGQQTVAVHFDEQQFHGNGLQHDLHLMRLEGGTDLEALGRWMNWIDPIGLIPPAPAQFRGGTQELAAGQTAYVTLDLESGDYAWIAEVDDPASKNMLVPFAVP